MVRTKQALIYTCAALFCCLSSFAQHATRSGYRSPLDIPLNLSGNFGEFRNNHFHSGLDIKTQGREGLDVHAIAAGKVSRINVSAYGYGNAVYIDHPDGHTSVYAHLSKFSPEIEAFVKDAQYELESWEVELYPGPGALLVDSSDVIAWSGNSGSSGGPHLHFEIRQTDTEFPMNPLLWGFEVADHRAPLLKGIQLTPLSDTSAIFSAHAKQYFATTSATGKSKLIQTSPIEVYGPVGIGAHTLDLLDNNSNKCGIYEMAMRIDGELIFQQRIDELDFSTKRFINAHSDYRELKTEKRGIHRAFRLPFNELDIYKTIKADGMILIEDDAIHTIDLEVKDVHGNTSSVSFELKKGKPEPKTTVALLPSGAKLFQYHKVNALRSDSCNVYMPEGRLYEDAYVWIEETRRPSFAQSACYQIGDFLIPIHESYILKIRFIDVREELLSKLFIMRYAPDNKSSYNRGGDAKLGWVTTRVKEFGNYFVAIDTIPPSIKVNSWMKSDRSNKTISFNITDDLSGVKKYEARVDGKWIRMSFYSRRARLTYEMSDEAIPANAKVFELKVWDDRGNVSVYTKDIP
ncbi:MAG: hypothetical protein ACJAU0_000724 [Flavobacteriales bacterium]|jgi:hypothetical protein